MENLPPVSRKGVYYDLLISPYRFESPYGDIFKFSSQKKLDIYTRKVEELKIKLIKLVNKFPRELNGNWKSLTLQIIEREVYRITYNKVQK